MKYDFHIHTTLSDGSLPPEEVVELAKKAQIDVMCLTDHDTLLSIDKAKKLDKKDKDIKIYGGLEVSTYMPDIKRYAHVLSYRCDRHNKALNRMVNGTIQRRTDSFYQSIDIINKKGDVHIDKEKVEKYKGINGFYKQHILKYLVDIGYTNDMHGETRTKIFSRAKGYAHVEFEYPETCAAIQVIRNAGGIPMLAHTFYSDNFHAIDRMIEAGLMGIEIYHPKHNKEQTEILLEFCEKRGLLVSCGSDFHGVFSETDTQIGRTSVDSEKTREFLSLLQADKNK